MISVFSRAKAVAGACGVLVMLLGGCSGAPEPATQKVYRPSGVLPKAQRPPSRLDSQPWPPGMGQPLSKQPQQQAMAAPRPAPQPGITAQSLAPVVPKVAILLPLSGKNAPLGQAMLNAAQLAVFEVAGKNFELMPRDTQGTPEGAALAARDAMGSGAQLLIGPLFAADVAAVKPIVQTSNINMVALSTDVSLAEPGAYVMGFAPAPQVERVVAYATERGLNRFAAVIPNGPYGAIVNQAFEAAVQRHGGTLVARESPARLQALIAKKDSFDALLLPLGGNELRQVAGALASAGVKAQLLGTGLWDERDLGKTSALVGGWFATAEPEARASFVNAYHATYSQDPPRLATLAYDSTAMAAALASRGAGFDRAALSNPNGFSGLDGIFRLNAQGQVERGLAVSEITPEGSRVIDPAPGRFTGL